MELTYFPTIPPTHREQIRQLLILADKEFIPPLSSRSSSTQKDLSGTGDTGGIEEYFSVMATQPVVLALEGTQVLGFMAFKENYTCDQISELPNLYASTCVVHPLGRGKGLMTGFYREMIRQFPGRSIFTRTWSTNAAHFRVLEKLGFSEYTRLKNHRGEGMDTVYFRRPAD